MVKVTTSILIDSRLKRDAKEILFREGKTMSNYIEECLEKLIENERRKKVE